ncbi:hypothetical protein GCG21_15660 [Pseudactinotalea sp. HY160]|uniref:hypothetical protein n=1 Tax=Pseudactinotalea sp. HY160 TaxID=2654490 RepID=UPI00128C071E|nr:hypothetical protein [Pseudactinotalea sp. HY160]MPV51421.1 hypothetical protein [Pseudactinotalea sp. HY160]
MVINDEHRQARLAGELDQVARTLAHSTPAVADPPDSYGMLADLASTTAALEQACQQLAHWHSRSLRAHAGTDDDTDPADRTSQASTALARAAAALGQSSEALHQAQAANSHLRWIPAGSRITQLPALDDQPAPSEGLSL